MTRKGQATCSWFLAASPGEAGFLWVLRPGWCPQQNEGGHGDEVQLLLGSPTSGRSVKTCIHATLITAFLFLENGVFGKEVIYVSM